jgi:hypothetical protein
MEERKGQGNGEGLSKKETGKSVIWEWLKEERERKGKTEGERVKKKEDGLRKGGRDEETKAVL